MEWKTDTWTDINGINGGKKYVNGNGILLADLNAIYNNLFYLEGRLKDVGVE